MSFLDGGLFPIPIKLPIIPQMIVIGRNTNERISLVYVTILEVDTVGAFKFVFGK